MERIAYVAVATSIPLAAGLYASRALLPLAFTDSPVVVDDVAGVLGATQAVLREVGELRKSIADLRGECIDPINGRIESQATAFRESVSQLEQSMRQGFDDLTERLTVTRTTAAVAAIAAIAAAVIAFVR